MRILITAGPTREYIDSVRFLSNGSSGQLGFAVASAARRRGHRVTLVHGPVALRRPAGVKCLAVTSAADMLEACRAEWPRHDVLIMSAAVADYAPVERLGHKLKKATGVLTVRLRRTADILATLSRERNVRQTVIGFAVEDRDARANAAGKLRRKRLDAIVLNRPANIGAARAAVEILTRDGAWQVWGSAAKTAVARRLVRLAEELHGARRGRYRKLISKPNSVLSLRSPRIRRPNSEKPIRR